MYIIPKHGSSGCSLMLVAFRCPLNGVPAGIRSHLPFGWLLSGWGFVHLPELVEGNIETGNSLI